MKPRAVEGHYAGRLLAPVLQGVQPERYDRSGVGMSENSEHPALLVRAVVHQVDQEWLSLGNRDLADFSWLSGSVEKTGGGFRV